MTQLSIRQNALTEILVNSYRRLIAGVETVRRAHSSALEFERLNGLSDQQLADRGLTRGDMARHLLGR